MYLISGGDLKEPEQSFRECLAIARETGRTDRLIDALQGLGSVEWRNCRYATASSYIQEAIGIARKVGHRELMALLTHLGAILRDTGDLQGAKLCLEEGLALTLRFGHQEKISAALSLLGDVERRLGEVGSARLHLLQALDIARDHDFHERLVEALKNLGRLSLVDGNAAAAEAYLEEGLRLTVNRSDAAHRSELLLAVAELRFEQQDLEAARDSFTQAAELARNANRQELVALSYYGLARVARSSGDTSTADQLGHASFDVLREIGYCDVNEVQAWLTHEDR
jgi:tetratricopeptide (TPR) repeat protein